MEFRDGPSLTKEPVSLPDFSWQWPFALNPDMGMATVPLSALGSSYISQFQLTFHLPVLGGMERNAHLGALLGSTQVPPKSGFPPHTQHKQRASLCPPTAFTANALLTLSPLLLFGGPHLPGA